MLKFRLLIIIVLCCAGCILYKLYKDDAIGNNRDSSKHYTPGQQGKLREKVFCIRLEHINV